MLAKPRPAAAAPVTAPPPKIDGDYQTRAWQYIEAIGKAQAACGDFRNNHQNSSGFRAFKIAMGAGINLDAVEDVIFQAQCANGQVGQDGERQVRGSIRSARQGAERAGPEYLEDRPHEPLTPAFTLNLDGDGGDQGGEQPRTDQDWLRHILDAEDGLWDTRESLRHIRDSAYARMCAPWAVLAHCAVRALAIVAPTTTLPPLIGGAGSLNTFVAIVAASGGGKSAAHNVAADLCPLHVEERNLGSGEGLVESYFKPKDKDTGEPGGTYESIVFAVDESDQLLALGSRSGSTLLSALRTAWTGGTLGFGYRSRTQQYLESHGYRMGLTVAMQAGNGGWLLEDAVGGTPQRFMWFPATDPRITVAAHRAHIVPLALPSVRELAYARTVAVPDEARDLILSEHVKRQQGYGDALDGHALFCREKFAYAFAVLDGRTDMSSEDWRLAGIAAEVSARTRAWMADSVARAEARANQRIGAARGQQQVAASEAKVEIESRKHAALAKWVLGKLKDGPLRNRDLVKSLDSGRRPYLPAVLAQLQADGLIEQRPVEAGRQSTIEWALVVD